MSNINSLINKIIDDANAEAQEIIDRAKAEESKIINKSKEEAEETSKEIIDKVKIEAETRKSRVISNAELQVRNSKLEAKQKIIDDVFSKALNKLQHISDEDYKAFITRTITSLEIEGEQELIINEKDKARINNDFIKNINAALEIKGKKANITLSSETRDMDGGFILARKGIEINCSFDAIVNSMRDELEGEVVEKLFG